MKGWSTFCGDGVTPTPARPDRHSGQSEATHRATATGKRFGSCAARTIEHRRVLESLPAGLPTRARTADQARRRLRPSRRCAGLRTIRARHGRCPAADSDAGCRCAA
eukprot:4050949-Prymnesium_polylepis.1